MEAQRFLDFYYNGQGEGVVLAQARICQDVPRRPTRIRLRGRGAARRRSDRRAFYLRMVYVVPQGDEAEITVRYRHDGVARDTDTVTMSGSIRYRTWTLFTLDEPGTWKFAISRTTSTGTQAIHTLDIQAVTNGSSEGP